MVTGRELQEALEKAGFKIKDKISAQEIKDELRKEWESDTDRELFRKLKKKK